MGRVAHPLSFGGFITTEGAPSLRSWQGWEPRTYNSPVLTFGNLGPCWGLANAFTTRPSRLPHPCRVLCDRWGLLTLFSRRARHQNPRPVSPKCGETRTGQPQGHLDGWARRPFFCRFAAGFILLGSRVLATRFLTCLNLPSRERPASLQGSRWRRLVAMCWWTNRSRC